ncbi:Acyl-CoA thioester hydrolase/BAAT N-terminal region [Deinococcus reticulitermitis]|uniref:Acyl-CoA thioester hydrolase/BAAT N-terminal region n=1 Tax=Deinococcus reticulitermitis TaxID=856736 RepID=A0A1H6UML4_9DEIO|nr:acyl-CoA thioester hydrolase/BAAT C-terminal domain-containing protein [Deinococcus reticulitermitis]SEI93528.1 Acyl-CoA thioester hydrolase/BAAT N-terminal region [Deinococcus reticulitermitis]
MSIFLSPTALVTAPFQVRADGLRPRTRVTLVAQTQDRSGEVWSSRAEFLTSESGTVDVERQAPVAGSYSGVDPGGLLWSLQPRADLFPAFFQWPDGGYDVTVQLVVDGEIRGEARTRRLARRPDLQATPVRDGGLYGTLFRPATGELRGACLRLGGSEGGLYDEEGALLASEGFLVFSLAYFGVPGSGLPEQLINIPLEYFGRALTLLQQQPEVGGRRVGVTGASKGAEAALLIGATYPQQVGAVAAIASGGLVFEGIDRTRTFPAGQPRSSWSVGGVPLPYLRYHTDWNELFSGPGPYSMTPAHRLAAERASADELAAATIPVERIAGPLLLVSGGDDQVWHAHELSLVAQRRRERAGLPVEHLSHPRAGHSLSLPGFPTYVRTPWTPMGGEDGVNAQLQNAAWTARTEVLGAVWDEGRAQTDSGCQFH